MKYNNGLKNKCYNPVTPFIWLIFIIIIVLTFSNFFRVGFTTADDLGYYMRTLKGSLLEDANRDALRSGRFYLIITKLFHFIPYITDNFYLTKIIQHSFLLLNFILAAFLIKKIFKLKEFALMAFLLLLAFLTVTLNLHIPTIAYPFFFTFSFSTFLISILLYIKYTETGKNKFIVISACLFGITLLFYEVYIMLLLFFIVFIFIRNLNKYGKSVFKTKSFYKEVIPYAIAGISYILIYFIYRKIIQAAGVEFYSGSSLAKDFSIVNFFKVLWNYNKSAVPTYMYYNFRGTIEMYSLLEGGHQHNFLYIIKNTPLTMLINSILVCFMFAYLLIRTKPDITWKKIGIGAGVLIILTFSVHILLGISQKYNGSSYWSNVPGYVTTFYSYFCVTLLILLIIYSLLKLSYNNKWIRGTVITLCTMIIFYFSIIIGYGNDHISRTWEHSQSRFKIMDKVLDKGIFDEIPENNTIIYTGDFNKFIDDFGGGVCAQGFKWKDYVYYKTGKDLNIFDNFQRFTENLAENPEQEIYCLTKYDNPKERDILLALSKINNHSLNIENEWSMYYETTSNESTLYYYSPHKNFIFEFYTPECNDSTVISINNNDSISLNCKLIAIRILNHNRKEEITSFTLRSTEPFSINNFMVSNIGSFYTKTYDLNLDQ